MRIPVALWGCFVVLLTSCRAQVPEVQPRHTRVSRPDTAVRMSCSIQMFGSPGSRRRPASVRATVQCGDETLFDEETSFPDLQETSLDHGITLFAETSFGFAYALLGSGTDVNLFQSRFSELTQVESRNMAAPLVIIDARLDITNITFDENRGAFRNGAAIVSGMSNVEFLNATFVENEGEEGVLHIAENARVDVENSIFLRNDGGQVGAIKMSGRAVGRVDESVFEANIAERFANELYVTDTATAIIDESFIYGQEAESDFDAFLRDGSLPDNDADNFTLPDAAVAAVTGRATMLITDTLVSGHVGRFGAIYVTDSPIFSALGTNFVGNRAVTGGGLFANANRAGFARVLACNFTDNLARQGGGLVFAGNGTYTVDSCHFENNSALYGGAIWGDYSESNTCPRASSGSRITLLNSTFAENSAQRSGGAFYIQCTDILADSCDFRENVAMNGDGGFLHAGNTFDLRFINCSITQNRASGSGGALYVDRSNDIVSDSCTWRDNTAGEDGGAIVSLNGHGIMFSESPLQDSISGRRGGAIHAINLTMVDFHDTSTVLNRAERRGGVFSGMNVSEFRWQNVTVEGNAGSSSAAIYVNGGEVFEIKQMLFPNHTATDGPAGAIQLIGVQNVSFQDVDFVQNTASDRCGALSVEDVQNLEIHNSLLELNRGTSGGALCIVEAGRVNLTALRFRSNVAEDGDGGAIYISSGGNLSMLHSVVEDNLAPEGFGGAISSRISEALFFANVTVLNNRADQSGGAFYIADGGAVEIQDSRIEANSVADGYGGAVYIGSSQDLSLVNLSVLSNSAAESGGAFYIADGGAVEILDSRIEDNLASDGHGGAVSHSMSRSLTLRDTTLHNNSAGQTGGALALLDLGSATIQASNLTNSSAADMGGCLRARSVRSFDLSDSEFIHCTSRTGGAAVFTGNSDVTAQNMVFENNTASLDGGAFVCSQQTTVDVDDSVFFHNSAPDGSTLNADCNCRLDVRDSRFYRDDDRPNNGDFFKSNEACTEIVSLRNAFFGGIVSNSDLEWYEWTGIAVGAAVGIVLLCCGCWCWRKRRAAAAAAGKELQAAKSDVENPPTEEDEESDDESEVTESTELEESSEEASTGERQR